MNWRNGSPFCDRRGFALSGRVTMPPVHRLGWPDRHCGQVPQNPDRQATTWSPTRTLVTSVADRLDDAGALVPEHDRPVEREASDAVDDMQVAVADAGRDGADQHLAPRWRVDIDRLDRQRRVRLAEDGGFDLHRDLLGRQRGFAESESASSRAGSRCWRVRFRGTAGRVSSPLLKSRFGQPGSAVTAMTRMANPSGDTAIRMIAAVCSVWTNSR